MDKMGADRSRHAGGSHSSFLGANEVAIAVVTATLVTMVALLLALVFYLIRTRSACTKPSATDEEKQSVLVKSQPPPVGVNTSHGAKQVRPSNNFLNLPSSQELSGSHPGSHNSKIQASGPIIAPSICAPPGSTSSRKSRGSIKDRRLSAAGSNSSLTLSIASSNSQISNTTTAGKHRARTPGQSRDSKLLDELTKPLTIAKLESIVDDPRDLSKEFMLLPGNFPEQIDTNFDKQKNRHTQILPNNQSRIRLQSNRYRSPYEGYINANYIRGYKSKSHMRDSLGHSARYIAAQGPLPSTVDDFWYMIWQEQVSIIVMLTKTRERNRNLCEKYWPMTSQRYGDIMVTCESSFSSNLRYQINEFLIADIESANQRTVEQYYYQEWPDTEQPEDASGVLKLIAEIEERQRQIQSSSSSPLGPILVHCSAGIGRTGCFIALSTAIERYEAEKTIDILETVAKIRLDRGGMVQTLEQYEFIHKALLQYIEKHSGKSYAKSRTTHDQIPE